MKASGDFHVQAGSGVAQMGGAVEIQAFENIVAQSSASKTGDSGAINLRTGVSGAATSGSLNISTGLATGTSGSIRVAAGSASTMGGTVAMRAGESVGADGGTIFASSGASADATSGGVDVKSSQASASSGLVTMVSGRSRTEKSGSILASVGGSDKRGWWCSACECRNECGRSWRSYYDVCLIVFDQQRRRRCR